MTGKPDYLPGDFTVWAQVEPYSMAEGGYVVNRISEGNIMKFGTFVAESDAGLFAKMKNDTLMSGVGI